MKGKKKKEDTVESRHVTAENQSLLRTLIATKPMNDARYRPVKRDAPYFEKEYPESRVTQNGSIREDHDDWKTPLGKYAFSSNNIPFTSCYIHLKLGCES